MRPINNLLILAIQVAFIKQKLSSKDFLLLLSFSSVNLTLSADACSRQEYALLFEFGMLALDYWHLRESFG